MSDEDKSSKTEKPSQHKLNKAKKKGQVFKSKDIVDNVSLISTFLVIKLLVSYIHSEYSKFLYSVIREDTFEVSITNLFYICSSAMICLLKILIPILSVTFLVTIIANFAQVGILFSSESLKLDFKKIDPISGVKRMFSKKSLVELLKFLIKLFVIIFVLGIDIKNNLISMNSLIFHDINASSSLMLQWLNQTLFKSILILFAFSFLDYFLQRNIYMSDMKMTKYELKKENKELNGDPLVKGKIKEKHRQISTNALIKATADATVLIANPTHIAICIKYEPGMYAPVVVAIARDNIAQKLKEVAKENDVPIIENKPLARALYNDADIGKPIPSEYFKAIAEILVSIMYAS